MALKVIGKGTFGTEGTDENIQSVTASESVSEVTAKDKDGNVIGVALTEHVTEKTLEVLATGGSEPPAIGEAYEGGIVTARSKTSSNTEFSRWSVTVKTWDGVTGSSETQVVQS
ncbi:MAG: hypothetical protein IJW39_02155 [Opitutales bacterium]|nr:hypothetical protein [Opitutales bacterium]